MSFQRRFGNISISRSSDVGALFYEYAFLDIEGRIRIDPIPHKLIHSLPKTEAPFSLQFAHLLLGYIRPQESQYRLWLVNWDSWKWLIHQNLLRSKGRIVHLYYSLYWKLFEGRPKGWDFLNIIIWIMKEFGRDSTMIPDFNKWGGFYLGVQWLRLECELPRETKVLILNFLLPEGCFKA